MKNESQTIEYKKSFGKEVIISLVAFANTDGGRVYVGMDDTGIVSGIDVGNETEQRYINEIKVATYPQLIPKTFVHESNGKTALVFEVSEYPVKPVAYKNRYYKRIKNSNHLMNLDEIVDLQQQSLQISYDAYPASSDMEAIHIDLIEKFCSKVNAMGRKMLLDDLNTNLVKLKMVDKEKKVSLAALLLFGDHNYSIHIGRFKSSDTIIDDVLIKDPLIPALDEAMLFIKKHINLSFSFDGSLTRKERWQYPLEAVRELLLNAVVHRDYKNTSDIVIKIFDDRIEFSNPGTIYGNLNIEDLYRDDYVSSIRNKLLAEAFYLLGDIEKYGTGFLRIRKALKEYPEIDFRMEEMGDYFKSVLTCPVVPGQVPEQQSDKHRTSTGQAPDKSMLLEYCQQPKSIKEMMKVFNFKHRETFMNNHLKPLASSGLIRMTIPEKPTSSKQRYVITEQGINEISTDKTGRR